MKQLCFILLFIWFSDSNSKEINLASNQAVVIAEVGRHNFLFEEISSTQTFLIKGGRTYRYRYFVVDAGRYYLKSIDPIFSNVDKLRFDRPHNNSQTFSVEEGSVNYLGGWLIDTNQEIRHEMNWNIERDYSLKYLKRMKGRNKELTTLPLVFSNEEGKVIPASWEDI